MPACTRATVDGVELRLKIVPGASRSSFCGLLGDRLKIRIAAIAQRDQANRAVLALIAERLNTKHVQLISGGSSAEKTVLLRGVRKLSPVQLADIGLGTMPVGDEQP
jgi:uncharacterized protein (TIGR00251 family)